MSKFTYPITFINDAISNPKGNKAQAANIFAVDRILTDCKDYDNYEVIESKANEIKEYITLNLTGKFKTKGEARKMVEDLKVLIGY